MTVSMSEEKKELHLILFISYCVARSELLVRLLKDLFTTLGWDPRTFRDASHIRPLSREIKGFIEESNVVLGILTKDRLQGSNESPVFLPSSRVLSEIRKARKLHKPVLIFAEKGVEIPLDLKGCYVERFSFESYPKLLIEVLKAFSRDELL